MGLDRSILACTQINTRYYLLKDYALKIFRICSGSNYAIRISKYATKLYVNIIYGLSKILNLTI